jgi:uncharacterized protein (DUF2235 family)
LRLDSTEAFNAARADGVRYLPPRGDSVDSFTAKTFRAAFSHEIKIKFIGVWDTVGALGIPLHLLQDVNMKFYEFHDTNLSSIVENAFHAIAVTNIESTTRFVCGIPMRRRSKPWNSVGSSARIAMWAAAILTVGSRT